MRNNDVALYENMQTRCGDFCLFNLVYYTTLTYHVLIFWNTVSRPSYLTFLMLSPFEFSISYAQFFSNSTWYTFTRTDHSFNVYSTSQKGEMSLGQQNWAMCFVQPQLQKCASAALGMHEFWGLQLFKELWRERCICLAAELKYQQYSARIRTKL